MTVFEDYARLYDLLYRDKDYAGEAEYINSLILDSKPGAIRLLNLGCGSGRHDRHFVDRNYSVTGVDCSERMLEIARLKANGYPPDRLEYINGDIRNLGLKDKFGVIISLFHVMSYQTSNNDLLNTFKSVRSTLTQDGIFIFDCWYGPGVLEDKPSVRFKELEDDKIKVWRIAVPEMHSEKNIVDVHYHIFVRKKNTRFVDEVNETHRMRYFFTPEIRLFLDLAGMKLLRVLKWMSQEPPDHYTWNCCFLAVPRSA